VKALYTVSEIGKASGLTRFRVLRLMRLCHIELLSMGRSVYVPLSEIRRKLKPVWREIGEVQRVLKGDVE
jgi:hypothetical protein